MQGFFAAAGCHRAEGTGGPENASLAGLPAGYILQQLADYKSGLRSTAEPSRKPQALMIAVAKAVTADEALAAASYFSGLKELTGSYHGPALSYATSAVAQSRTIHFVVDPDQRFRRAAAQTHEMKTFELSA